MIEEALKQLGLGEYESKIYAVLLSNSPSGATLIATKCNLSRSSVYTTLDALIAKGLVGTTHKNEVKQFIAMGYPSLDQIVKKEKEQVVKKEKLLESIKENLQIMGRNDLNIPQVMFFEGQEGLKRIYLSMIRQAQENETMYILRDEFVWDERWSFVFSREWHNRVKRLKVEKNMDTKLLINDSKLERGKEKFYKTRKSLKMKYLPKKNSVKQFAFYIVGDMTSILSMENNNLVGIQITNNHLADNFRNMFSVLWNRK